MMGDHWLRFVQWLRGWILQPKTLRVEPFLGYRKPWWSWYIVECWWRMGRCWRIVDRHRKGPCRHQSPKVRCGFVRVVQCSFLLVGGLGCGSVFFFCVEFGGSEVIKMRVNVIVWMRWNDKKPFLRDHAMAISFGGENDQKQHRDDDDISLTPNLHPSILSLGRTQSPNQPHQHHTTIQPSLSNP